MRFQTDDFNINLKRVNVNKRSFLFVFEDFDKLSNSRKNHLQKPSIYINKYFVHKIIDGFFKIPAFCPSIQENHISHIALRTEKQYGFETDKYLLDYNRI